MSEIKNRNRFDYVIYDKVCELDNYLRYEIVNSIPNIHRDIRIHLLDESYNLLKSLLSATYSDGKTRSKYLFEMKVEISLIQRLLDIIKSMNIISKNKFLHVINILSIINNIVYGWIINEEKK